MQTEAQSAPTTIAQPPTELELFGPFHRVKSPTQSKQDAIQQVQSRQLWGRPRRDSNIPQVQAYAGALPVGEQGIEFTTTVPPDRGTTPGKPRWTGPRKGVTVDQTNGFAKIECHDIRASYPSVVPETEETTTTTTIRAEETVATANDAGVNNVDSDYVFIESGSELDQDSSFEQQHLIG